MSVDNLLKSLEDDFDFYYDHFQSDLAQIDVNLESANTPVIKMLKIEFLHYVLGDLYSFTSDDPAANNNFLYANESNSFMSVKIYRFGKVFREYFIKKESDKNKKNRINKDSINAFYKKIDSFNYKLTNISLNINADIGQNFIVDHGHYSRICDCAKIGDCFHMMQDVNIGFSNGHIYDAPEIGKNVLVWSSSSILGNIKIGDNSVIGTKCLVYKDLEANSTVSLKTNNVISNSDNAKNCQIYGFSMDEHYITLYGNNLNNIELSVVKKIENTKKRKVEFIDHCELKANIIERDIDNIKFEVVKTFDKDIDDNFYFKVIKNDAFYIFTSLPVYIKLKHKLNKL